MKTFAQFAYAYGQNDRLTHEATLHWHREYASMEAEQQGEMRDSWILNYLMGALDLSEPKAQKICDTSRDKRSAAHQKVYDRARAQFTYHIVRAGKSPKADTPAVRIPKAAREAFESHVLSLGLSKAQLSVLFAETLKGLE